MSKTASSLASAFLLVLMLGGIWLGGYERTRYSIGLFLAIGAALGLIFLNRHENASPLEEDERETWEIVRSRGKFRFILRSVIIGIFGGLIFLLFQLIRSFWMGETFSANYIFILVALFFILYIGSSYYAAVRNWALYEERYKDSVQRQTRPKN